MGLRQPSRKTYERAYRKGQPVTARAIAATGAGVAIELPPGLPGFVKRAHLPCSVRADPAAAVGETLEGLLLTIDREDGVLIVSPRHLAAERCKAALGKRRPVPVRYTGANRGGLLVDAYGLRGFLPRSEMQPADAGRHAELVGGSGEAYVIRASIQQVIVSAFPPRVRRRRRLPQ